MAESEEELKKSLDEGERGEWKGWLETQHSKKYHGIQPHHFMAKRWGKMETVTGFIWGGGAPKSLQMVIAAMKLKDACSS